MCTCVNAVEMLTHFGSETIKQHEFPQAEITHHGLYRMYQGGLASSSRADLLCEKVGQHN